MKQFMTGMIIPLILMASACGKTGLMPSDGRLTGVWVHETTGTDTIDFDAHARSDKNAFELKRKPGSPKAGPYWYEVKGDSIQVHWWLSSAMAETYAFKLSADGRSFRIGAFVPFVEGQTIHTFKKIK